MKQFQGKSCIVTGAASGIGKSLVDALAKRGAHVVATDVNTELLHKSASAVTPSGGEVTARELDVTDYEAFRDVIDDVVAKRGRLDYIFNNAGIVFVGELRDQSIEQWRKVLNVNLHGVVHGSLLAYKQMLRQGGGHIVNISSIEGLIPFPATMSYVTSKFGVMGLSQSLWIEGKDLGVAVSAVCPGFIKTPIFETSPMVGYDRQQFLKALSVWERFGITPDKCAQAILDGVARNKAIIPVTFMARIMWWLGRLSPTFLMNLTRKDFKKWRDKVRGASEGKLPADQK